MFVVYYFLGTFFSLRWNLSRKVMIYWLFTVGNKTLISQEHSVSRSVLGLQENYKKVAYIFIEDLLLVLLFFMRLECSVARIFLSLIFPVEASRKNYYSLRGGGGGDFRLNIFYGSTKIKENNAPANSNSTL